MDEIKKAFQKVKEDFEELNTSLNEVREHILFLHDRLNEISKELIDFKSNQLPVEVQQTDKQTVQHLNPTYSSTHTTNPTDNQPDKGLKEPNFNTSTGNDGVPTDRQTDKQTNRQTHSTHESVKPSSVEEVSNIIDSLDAIKRNLRRQFKQLTEQEFLVFSTLYQLDDSNQHEVIDYTILATTLNLTESSIRDYIGRLIKKGISIEKAKINNKKVHLSISPNLKKIATLSTIMSLRDI